MRNAPRLLGTAVLLAISLTVATAADRPLPTWKHLSSKNGDLPVPPGGSTQQTGAVVGDFDGDRVNDFILSFRQKPPALAWYRRTVTGWDVYAIEEDYLTIEAGGAVGDLDGDGDPDLLNKPYAWETPRVDVWVNNGSGGSKGGS